MIKVNNKVYKIFLSAGEASGDNLGAELITSLKKGRKGRYVFYGIVGHNMEKAGNIKSIFPIQELSVIGYFEVVPKLFKILFRLLQATLFIRKIKPNLIITIDAPGFNFLLAKFARVLKIDTHIIHYVAPTVWAYKPERAKQCAKLFDYMMVIFPFEKKYFDDVGLKCSYVGNPTISKTNHYTGEQKTQIKQKYGLSGKKIISIMPGSRDNELNHHLPILKEFVQKMNHKYNNLHFVIHTLNNTEDRIKECFCMENVLISKDAISKIELSSSSDLIVCKSGTSVLESVAKVVPIIAFYKVNSLTAYILKRKLKIKYVTICNIMMNQPIIPELLQENFSTRNLLKESKKLLYNSKAKEKQRKALNLFLSQFNPNTDNKIKIEKIQDIVHILKKENNFFKSLKTW